MTSQVLRIRYYEKIFRSTILLIICDLDTIKIATFHFISLKTATSFDGHSDPDFGQSQKCGGVKLVEEITTPLPPFRQLQYIKLVKYSNIIFICLLLLSISTRKFKQLYISG